jgi:hypothetical protein
MIELLAVVVSEPTSAPLWGLLIFAAGMYPVGFMLGSSCSPCCNPCTLCTSGRLPETVTATLSGFPDSIPVQGPDLISLSFASCFGSGASAEVTDPGGDPDTDKGPISAVEVTNGGSGYAVLGRVAPTLTISGGSGSGATFTPTLTSTNDGCGVPTWSLDSVSVSGGTGYVHLSQLTISAASGDTEVSAATATVYTATEPTLSVAGTATATVTLVDNLDGTWGVDSVTVTSGGSGYVDGDPLVIEYDTDDVEVTPAVGVYRTVRLQPTVSIEPFAPFASGTGATLSATLSQTTGPDGRDAWQVASATITAAGSGYTVGDLIAAFNTNPSGIGADGFIVGEVTSTNGTGGITALTASGGLFYDLSDELDEVEVSSGGEYYHETGIPQSVNVDGGGSYYREDASEDPLVSSITITITQTAPSTGSGATLLAVVDDDTASETFGQITGITIDDGGDDYLAWEFVGTELCCGAYLNGTEVVLQKDPADPCRYVHIFCGGYRLLEDSVGSPRIIESLLLTVAFNGEGVPATASLSGERTNPDTVGPAACSQSWTGESPTSCADFSLTATNDSGASIAVTAGGDYNATAKYPNPYVSTNVGPYASACHVCCRGEEAPPDEIEVEVTDTWNTSRPSGLGDFSGTYVLPANNPFPLWWQFSGSPTNDNLNPIAALSVKIRHEACEQACSQCPPKCEVQVDATIYHFFGANNSSFIAYNFFSLGGQEDQCGYCVETPICSPSGESGSFGDLSKTAGTVTIS